MSVDNEIESSDLLRKQVISILKKEEVVFHEAASFEELQKESKKIQLESLSLVFINGSSDSIMVEACLKLITDQNLLKSNPEIIVFGFANETQRQQLADSGATMLMMGSLQPNSIDQVLSVVKPKQ